MRLVDNRLTETHDRLNAVGQRELGDTLPADPGGTHDAPRRGEPSTGETRIEPYHVGRVVMQDQHDVASGAARGTYGHSGRTSLASLPWPTR